MPTGTVRLHRVLRARPEKIYRAFLDGEALARWLPPNGFTCKIEQLDAMPRLDNGKTNMRALAERITAAAKH